jgi:hypothetical protein
MIPQTTAVAIQWLSSDHVGPPTDECNRGTMFSVWSVFRKLQRGLSSMETWCECWIIEINEDKTYGIYFSRIDRLSHILILNGRNIPFVNGVKYVSVIYDKKITWRLHIEMIEAKAFRFPIQK